MKKQKEKKLEKIVFQLFRICSARKKVKKIATLKTK